MERIQIIHYCNCRGLKWRNIVWTNLEQSISSILWDLLHFTTTAVILREDSCLKKRAEGEKTESVNYLLNIERWCIEERSIITSTPFPPFSFSADEKLSPIMFDGNLGNITLNEILSHKVMNKNQFVGQPSHLTATTIFVKSDFNFSYRRCNQSEDAHLNNFELFAVHLFDSRIQVNFYIPRLFTNSLPASNQTKERKKASICNRKKVTEKEKGINFNKRNKELPTLSDKVLRVSHKIVCQHKIRFMSSAPIFKVSAAKQYPQTKEHLRKLRDKSK